MNHDFWGTSHSRATTLYTVVIGRPPLPILRIKEFLRSLGCRLLRSRTMVRMGAPELSLRHGSVQSCIHPEVPFGPGNHYEDARDSGGLGRGLHRLPRRPAARARPRLADRDGRRWRCVTATAHRARRARAHPSRTASAPRRSRRPRDERPGEPRARSCDRGAHPRGRQPRPAPRRLRDRRRHPGRRHGGRRGRASGRIAAATAGCEVRLVGATSETVDALLTEAFGTPTPRVSAAPPARPRVGDLLVEHHIATPRRTSRPPRGAGPHRWAPRATSSSTPGVLSEATLLAVLSEQLRRAARRPHRLPDRSGDRRPSARGLRTHPDRARGVGRRDSTSPRPSASTPPQGRARGELGTDHRRAAGHAHRDRRSDPAHLR